MRSTFDILCKKNVTKVKFARERQKILLNRFTYSYSFLHICARRARRRTICQLVVT